MDELRQQVGLMAVDRIRRVKQMVEAFEAGDMSAAQAVSRIEEIASGDDERIVKVGRPHTPEVQT